jgi:hypothetical protein
VRALSASNENLECNKVVKIVCRVGASNEAFKLRHDKVVEEEDNDEEEATSVAKESSGTAVCAVVARRFFE